MNARNDLRSGKRECQVPVQLQLAKDDDFLAGNLASFSGTEQVFDSEHSDDSISKISSPSVDLGKGAGAGGPVEWGGGQIPQFPRMI